MTKLRTMPVMALLVVSAFSVLMLTVPAPAFATPSTSCSTSKVSSGYAATTNYHGVNVPIGTLVTAYGCTTDTSIVKVLFYWVEPDGSTIAFHHTVSTYTTVTDADGVPARQFTDTYTPNLAGDWRVKVYFCNADQACTYPIGHPKGVAFTDQKATSFLVLPEVPIIGTALLGGAMMGGFFLFSRTRSRAKIT